jgi:glycerol-3-phosphate dehydrogenase
MTEEKDALDFKVKRLAVLGDGKWGGRVYDLLTNPLRHGGRAPPYSAELVGPLKKPSGEVVLGGDGKAMWGDSRKQALSEADLIFVAIPVKNYRETIRTLSKYINPKAFVINGSKGCEYNPDAKTIYLPHEILRQELQETNRPWVASLCGPNIQHEIDRGRVTCAEAACWIDLENFREDWPIKKRYLEFLSNFFSVDKYVVVGNPSIVGVELSGGLKNLFANPSGSFDGYYDTKNAHNTRSTLLALADYDIEFIFKEISREKVGWEVKVPAISGLGDLIATCSSPKSRNYTFGYERGIDFRKGDPELYRTAEEICKKIGQVVESINTLESIMQLCEDRGWIDQLLIIPFIYKMVHGESDIEEIYSVLDELKPRLTKRNELLFVRDYKRYRQKQRGKEI